MMEFLYFGGIDVNLFFNEIQKRINMNLFKFFILAIMLSVFAACGDGDEGCVQADWVGTYSGTVSCTNDGVTYDEESVTLTITASGTDRLIISYVTPSLTNEIDPLLFNDCELRINFGQSGATQAFIAELDVENLYYEEHFVSNTSASICEFTVTRI